MTTKAKAAQEKAAQEQAAQEQELSIDELLEKLDQPDEVKTNFRAASETTELRKRVKEELDRYVNEKHVNEDPVQFPFAKYVNIKADEEIRKKGITDAMEKKNLKSSIRVKLKKAVELAGNSEYFPLVKIKSGSRDGIINIYRKSEDYLKELGAVEAYNKEYKLKKQQEKQEKQLKEQSKNN